MTVRQQAGVGALVSPQQAWYAAHVPLRHQLIVDVGANVGELSRFFWDAAEGTSRVISVEPLSENVAAIREKIRLSAASGWTVEECAVSGKEGTVELAVSQTERGMLNSTVVPREGTRSVRCRRLAILAPEATVIKLDIEGHEYAVLEDSLPRLDGATAWAVELHQVRGRALQPVLASFLVHGFRVFGAVRDASEPGNRWQSAELAPSLDWTDIPASRKRRDGSDFKMLHIVALRPAR
jgi:FkbM family methyltransferase